MEPFGCSADSFSPRDAVFSIEGRWQTEKKADGFLIGGGKQRKSCIVLIDSEKGEIVEHLVGHPVQPFSYTRVFSF